ncbi:MAG TPA: recombinase family protein [Xanthobacteraceae bacterium]
MTGRAAIYARFSSDLQRDRSIDDQVALCREYAGRNGYNILSVFSDRAITGSSFQLRRGIQDLLQAARAGDFEFVIAVSLSRNIISLRPAAIDAYIRDLTHLDEVINADLAAGDETAARVVRQMIETVTIVPSPKGQVPGVIVRGQLGSIRGLSDVGGADGAG